MRVAALYDVHGNLPALEAVLAEVRAGEFDEVVVGGDVYPGPMADEALDTLLALELPVRFLAGNGERETLALAAGGGGSGVPQQVRATVRWSPRRLAPEHRRAIAGWPPTLRAEIDGLGGVLFCHATPESDTEIFTRRTSEARVAALFAGCAERLAVCGHTHMPFDRRVGELRVVNAGSVGMPFGEPGAYWLALGPGVERRRTSYDLERAAERIRASDYPEAEDFAARNVLAPPSEEKMLKLFGGAER